ncbi:MucR family transcriptional regulator [Sphingomonas sp. AR_OL41]|uniref:MucR family transcriptional regulator n=1 Tax=Sphingomonas sp. AR_OL41 TaxID=3042729 RepID=UPI002480280C|nr:MucR family transcriptional regulator [Sphingomonas sp. AR_OL41]MDH7972535.1 MucR family transcriptional regulator [Sphingomonas sp. AR_OL41]
MEEPDTLIALTADIAASFLTNNRVAIGDIGGMIASVHGALAGLGQAPAPIAPEFIPAVTLRKSLADPTKIISMIDGKSYAVLKRHLTTQGLTPAEYRTRYNLPADYPMTAPAYSEMRKAMAVKIGLGRKKAGRPKLGVVTPSGDAPTPIAQAPRKTRVPSRKAAPVKVDLNAE